MDNPNRKGKQNEPPIHHTSNPRYALQDSNQQTRSLAGGSTERLRSAPIDTASPTARGMGATGTYSSYYQEPTAAFSTANMPATAMAYGPEYGQDSRQQTQAFGGYSTATMMYNVPQPSAQAPVYDTQQFGSRQPTAMPMMTPDVTSTYFNPEGGSATASNLQPPSSQTTGASSGVYQPNNPSIGYSGSVSSVNQMAQSSATADASMTEDQDHPEGGALEEKWRNYQRQLGTIFQEIVNGSLESASETLLSVSSWLLSQVADLGLHLDDANLHADRMRLWDDFNNAWLALGQRQKDMMQSGQPLSTGQALMSKKTLKKMGNELVRLCDGIERHGLVDYQYGVWEDRIVDILGECLDLFDGVSEEGGRSGGSR